MVVVVATSSIKLTPLLPELVVSLSLGGKNRAHVFGCMILHPPNFHPRFFIPGFSSPGFFIPGFFILCSFFIPGFFIHLINGRGLFESGSPIVSSHTTTCTYPRKKPLEEAFYKTQHIVDTIIGVSRFLNSEIASKRALYQDFSSTALKFSYGRMPVW